MQTGMGSALSEVTVVFAIALAFALLIERLLEVLKTAYDLLDSRYDWHRFWTRRTEHMRDFLERRLRLSQHLSPQAQAAALARFSEMLLGTAPGAVASLPILSGDLVRAAGIRLAARVIGMAAGVALALRFGIDLLALSGLVVDEARNAPAPTTLGMVVTGIAIGLGSAPVHKIITTLENRRARRDAGAARPGQEGANA
ncbi:MAG TPA: hypothetical protein VF192_11925 [Longimicrobiales bacterium]